MLASLSLFAHAAQVGLTRYGFFGLRGFGGVILGLVVLLIVCAVLWQIFTLLAAKFGVDATGVQIIRLLLTLLIVLWFLQMIFGIFG
jgi:hypothetical protein